MWGLCNPELCDLWPLWLQARLVCRPALWRLWNHREVQQGPSSNNCSVLRGEAFPPLTQHSLVLQPTKHLSARLRGRAGHRVGWGDCTGQLVGFSVDQGSVGIGWTCQIIQPRADKEGLCTLHWQVWDPLRPLWTSTSLLYTSYQANAAHPQNICRHDVCLINFNQPSILESLSSSHGKFIKCWLFDNQVNINT